MKTGAERQREYYQRNLAMGRCGMCGRKQFRAGRCRKHYRKNQATKTARMVARTLAGTCLRCGDVRFRSAYCEPHFQLRAVHDLSQRLKHRGLTTRRACSRCRMSGHTILTCSALWPETKATMANLVTAALRPARRAA